MKDKLFLDTNVVIDLLGEREHYYNAAAQIATMADKSKIFIIVSALTYSTAYYLLSKFENKELVKEKIRKFKTIADTADLSNSVIDRGLSSKFTDFEDALQYYCAVNLDCNILISRNGKDFRESDIPVLTPDEYLSSLKVK